MADTIPGRATPKSVCEAFDRVIAELIAGLVAVELETGHLEVRRGAEQRTFVAA